MTSMNSFADVEAELAVLGGVLLEPSLLPQLELEVDDFSVPSHGHVFAAMRNLEAAGSPIDVVAISDQLERENRTTVTPALLGECALRCPTPDNVEYYAGILRRHRIGREVVNALERIRKRLSAGQLEGPDALLEALSQLSKISTGERDERFKTIGQIVKEITSDLASGRIESPCIKSGLKKLDERIGGIPFGVPSLILAPPASGKSTMALMLCNAAEKQGDRPLLYSYEDGWKSYGRRAMAGQSGVPTEAIRRGEFVKEQLNKLQSHMPSILKRKAGVIRAAGMTVEELIRDVKSRRLRHRGEGTTGRLVVVDYIQRMPLPSMAGGTKNDRMGEISKRLFDLSSTQDIAVVICSQMSRTARREARPPALEDVRDCGEIEQDVKLAIGLHRPSIYGQPPTGSKETKAAPPTLVELHVIKNNDGEGHFFIDAYWDLETHTIVGDSADLAERNKSR
jgi:replicative DNA helicase